MTMLRDLSTLYTSMFSLVLFITLFEYRTSKKKFITMILTLAVPLMLVNFVLFVIVGPVTMSTLLLFTCSLPSLILFFSLAKYRDGRFLFTFCFADTVILELTHATSILDFFLGNTYIFMIISRLILCPLLCYAAWKWVRPVYRELQAKLKRGWFTFALIALLFYILMSLEMSVPSHITQRPKQLPAYIILLILIPAIYTHIYLTLQQQQRFYQMDMKDKILQIQVDNMRNRIEEFHAVNQKFRTESHDFRHKLHTIATLIEAEQYDTVQALVTEYSDGIQPQPLQHYCNNPILDAVLSSFLQKAGDHNIQIVTRLNFPDTLPVNESELATVFANALENAIHACQKVAPERRFLEIIVRTAPCFMFQIRNSCEGCAVLDAQGIPVSSKKNHGFGTHSIVAFCEKNKANYEFKPDSQFFSLRISFTDTDL